ncbi:MAG: LCP family protein [Actinomycetota bacterium]
MSRRARRPEETEAAPRGRVSRAGRALKFALLAILVLGLTGGAMLSYARLRLRANSQEIQGLVPQRRHEPMNVLVVGSDSREGLSESDLERFDPTGGDRTSGRRADTIVLVHLDERREQVVLVHFPRDLRVRNSSGGFSKINGVYQSGPEAMVRAVESFSGLPIHHFVEVDFNGFQKIVDALGGVRVFFERPIKDRDSGLDVPAGCVELRGEQALAFVRVRKIDDDFGRIARQQLFIRLVLEEFTSATTLLNPVKTARLVALVADNVITDARLTASDIKTLALRLRTFDPERVDMRVVPSAPKRIKGVSYVIADQKKADELFAAIRDRQPLPDHGRSRAAPTGPGGVAAMSVLAASAEPLPTLVAQPLNAPASKSPLVHRCP